MTPLAIARRLGQAVLAVLGIITVTFVLIHNAPGDPAAALAGEGGDPGYIQAVREKFGLDRPLPQQYLTYAGNVLQGDLGTSLVRGQPVAAVIGDRLGPTLLLMGSALALSSVGGVVLGALAARRPGRTLDVGITTAALVGYATPTFWLAQLAVLTLAFRAGWFPVQGLTDARSGATGLAAAVDVARHLVLPAAVLAVSEVAIVARLARSGLVHELASDYVRTARAGGVSPRRALTRHALPNALVPVVTIVGARFGTVLSGAVLVETVFAWPGLGLLLITSTRSRDYPVLLGLVLLASFAVVVANLVTDLVNGRIDPRISGV